VRADSRTHRVREVKFVANTFEDEKALGLLACLSIDPELVFMLMKDEVVLLAGRMELQDIEEEDD